MDEQRGLVISTLVSEQVEVSASQSIYIPDLPAEARPSPSADTSHTWLDAYVAWAYAKNPMTPRFFHEAAALWLPSVAIARRLVLPVAYGKVFPNLYIAWIAASTLYAKSTSMELAAELAEEVFPHLLAPQDITPEALIDEMAGREPTGLKDLPKADKDLWEAGRAFSGQRGLLLDELSALLATARRGYGAGLVEAMLRFHDCAARHRRLTKGGGLVVVRNSYLAFFGASTPASLRKYLLDETLWHGGWWPRFALLYPEAIPPWRDSVDAERPALLADRLYALYEALPRPIGAKMLEALEVELGPGVHGTWRAYKKALRYDLLMDAPGRLRPYYGRLPAKGLKIAILLAALEWAGKTEREEGPTIELRHWWRAQKIAEAWRASAHRLLAAITKSQIDSTAERVRGIVGRANPQGITMREIKRRMQDRSASDVERAVEELVGKGALEAFQYKPPRGRSTVRYRIP